MYNERIFATHTKHDNLHRMHNFIMVLIMKLSMCYTHDVFVQLQ